MRDYRVIFVVGPSGAGKSSLAASLARRLNYRQLSLDMIRKTFKGDTRKAWLEIWKAIRNGRRVVVDATGASRIFRLVYRAAVFEHASPVVVRLGAREECLHNRLRKKKMGLLLLGSGKEITERYLIEGAASTSADLDIDTTRLTRRQVLGRVINYLRKQN
jgi:adenylate kinase family enzyme